MIIALNRKHGDAKTVTSESAERHESSTDERIRTSGIDGLKIGYR